MAEEGPAWPSKRNLTQRFQGTAPGRCSESAFYAARACGPFVETQGDSSTTVVPDPRSVARGRPGRRRVNGPARAGASDAMGLSYVPGIDGLWAAVVVLFLTAPVTAEAAAMVSSSGHALAG